MSKTLYYDLKTVLDLVDDLCEQAHAQGENVECLRDAERIIWNWYAAKHCPQLMYASTKELILESAS